MTDIGPKTKIRTTTLTTYVIELDDKDIKELIAAKIGVQPPVNARVYVDDYEETEICGSTKLVIHWQTQEIVE